MIRVGITIGDINGIGPEIIIKALRDNRILQDCIPIIYGSTKTISFHKKKQSRRGTGLPILQKRDGSRGQKSECRKRVERRN